MLLNVVDNLHQDAIGTNEIYHQPVDNTLCPREILGNDCEIRKGKMHACGMVSFFDIGHSTHHHAVGEH